MKRIIVTLTLITFYFSLFSQVDIHNQVDSLIMQENYNAALVLAKEALQKNPNDTKTLCALACVYRNMSYQEVLTMNAKSKIKEGEEGWFALNRENFNEIFGSHQYFEDSLLRIAEDLYLQIIEIDNTYYDAYFNLLNSYEVNHDYDRYFELIDLFISNLKSEENTKNYLADLASKLMQKQKMEQALILYNKIVEHYPDFSEAISDLGTLYFNIADFEKSKEMYEKSYDLNKTDTLVIENLVRINILLGRYKDAYYYSQQMLNYSKSNFSLFTSGTLARMLNETNSNKILNDFIEKRKSNLDKEIEEDFWLFAAHILTLSSIDSVSIRDIAYQFYSNNYYFDLIVYSNIILDESKNDPLALQALAFTYDQLGHSKKVIEILETLESIDKDGEIMPKGARNYNFGRNYYILEDYQLAIEYLSKVDDDNLAVSVNYLLGECYYFQNDYENAIKYHTINSELDDQQNMYYINKSIFRLKELSQEQID